MEVKKIKRYLQYKDSGIKWLAEIPEHWEIKPGFIVVEERNEKNKDLRENTVLSLSYGNIIIKSEDKLTGLVPESFETYQIVYPNDIIIRPTDLQNDKVSLRTGFSQHKGIITSAYINLKVKDKFYPYYVYLFLYTIDITKIIYGLGSGLRQNLSFLDLKRFPFPIPPLSEQKSIADYLDKKTEQIDKAIVQKEQMIELLKERKQILINRAVTRGLNPDVSLKDSGVDWIGEVPENWGVTASKHLLTMPITDGPHTTPELFENGIPFISAEAIKNGSIDFEKKRGYISRKEHDIYCLKYKPQRDDIYMIKSGATTGNVAIVETDIEFSIWSPLAVFRADKFLIKPQFLYYSLQAAYFRKGVEISWSYGTQQNIGMGILSNLPIVYCPLDEQASIVDYLKQHLEKIDKAIYQKQEEIEKLKEYKSTVIDSAVTGKICLMN